MRSGRYIPLSIEDVQPILGTLRTDDPEERETPNPYPVPYEIASKY